jgi:phospholipid/cholesterol/gamma-HCH transport system substrate-binding protein
VVVDRRVRTGLAVLSTLALLAAGAFVYTRLPDVTTARLPGAAGGSDTYPVTAEFNDVLDLVPNSTVRVADVPVGRVTRISVGVNRHAGHVAVVRMQIDSDYRLPAGTTASIRSTSLLGEKYVALTAPVTGRGSLEATGEIPLESTTQDVEVEQLLASLGALLNGGGIQQLSTLTREFSAALDGREASTRQLLRNLNAIVGRLDRSRADLVAAIDSAQRLSSALAAQQQVVGRAIEALDPATGVLARQERALTRALRSLDTLDAKATHVIRAGQDATVADLEALAPVLRELGKVADQLPANLTTLVTYPYPDNSVRAFSGAYGAVTGATVIDLKTLLASIAPTAQRPSGRKEPGSLAPPAPVPDLERHAPDLGQLPDPLPRPPRGGRTPRPDGDMARLLDVPRSVR